MLRNLLTTLPGFVTWPCDEIPFIWRHGWRGHPHDEFSPDMAHEGIRSYLAGRFRAIQPTADDVVVEKTCANSLRLGYVAAAVPDARFLVIVRNPHDAIASAMLRWTSSFDLGYSLAKARFVPPGDVPYYGLQYLGNRLTRLLSREKKLGRWGPVFDGMHEARRTDTLAELAARQWARCMVRTLADLPLIDPSRHLSIRYEDFVRDPGPGLARILEYLHCQRTPEQMAQATATVRDGSIGKGLRGLSVRDKTLIDQILQQAGLPGEFLREEAEE